MKKNRKKNRAKLIDKKVKIWGVLVFSIALVASTALLILDAFIKLPSKGQNTVVFISDLIEILATFLVPLVSIWITYLVIRSKNRLEEELKIEPDHHKIIHKYNGHKRDIIDYTKKTDNVLNEDGVLMSLKNVSDKMPSVEKDDDQFSEEHFERERDLTAYKSGRLLLPCLNVFTNNKLNVTIQFQDSTTPYQLPAVLKGHETKLISAHKASSVSNNATVRLKDFSYNKKTNVLTLTTERSNYLDMLMTNRCMDFDIGGMSVRSLCESEKTVKSLKDSDLCNQIGINGLVYTTDNYLLVEKRGRKKAVWKNKFAQPISLAFKMKDLGLSKDQTIGKTAKDAEESFKKIISKTLNSNFGLAEGSDYSFRLSENFMGIARDLLEGGKPNLYFYVVVNMSAQELKAYLEHNYKLAIRVGQARDALHEGIAQTSHNAPSEKNEETETNETPLSKISNTYKTALISLIKEGYVTVTDNKGECELQWVSARQAADDKSEDADKIIERLNKMNQSKVDECLAEILSKKLPKMSKDKLDSQFYLIKREDIKLDFNYATEIPSNRALGVQRIFAPCVTTKKEKNETKRIRKYTIGDNTEAVGKPLRYGCGEALLTSLYYAAVLDLEKHNDKTEKKDDSKA